MKTSELQKSLFQFAKDADRINAELRNVPLPIGQTDNDKSLIGAIRELQPYLSLTARRAEYLASCLKVVEERNT
jgi:hypothetical protein